MVFGVVSMRFGVIFGRFGVFWGGLGVSMDRADSKVSQTVVPYISVYSLSTLKMETLSVEDVCTGNSFLAVSLCTPPPQQKINKYNFLVVGATGISILVVVLLPPPPPPPPPPQLLFPGIALTRYRLTCTHNLYFEQK